MEWQKISARLDQLEVENRRWKWAGTIVAGLLAAHLVSAFLRRDSQLIEAQEIRLVDASGRVGVVMDASSVTLTSEIDEDGSRLRSRLQPQGLDVSFEREGRTLAILEVNTKELDFIDYVREQRAVVTPAMLGLQNGIFGVSEQSAWVAIMRESGFEFRNHQGRLLAQVGRVKSASSSAEIIYPSAVVVYDAEGQVIWQAPGR